MRMYRKFEMIQQTMKLKHGFRIQTKFADSLLVLPFLYAFNVLELS